MNHMTVATTQAQKGFYPTPPTLAAKLVDGIKMHHSISILEPSAGTGNLILALAPAFRRFYYSNAYYGRMQLNVDCCEIDPALRGILQENFSAKALDTCKEAQKQLLKAEGCDNERELSDNSRTVYDFLRDQEILLDHTKVRIAHDDFLSYHTENHYGATRS